MSKSYIVEDSKTVALKKAYIVEDSKTVALKKAYIVEGGKTVKLWGGMGRFLNQAYVTSDTGILEKKSLLSDDGLTWNPSTNERPQNFQDIIFAKGKFWGVYVNYQTANIYSSVDGDTWTLVKSIKDSATPKTYFGYNSIIRYENGVFIVHGEYAANNRFACYSTDGETWKLIRKYSATYNNYTISGIPLDIRYGTVDGVSGWYMLASDKSNVTMIYRFKTLSDLVAGKIEGVAYTSISSNRGILDFRGGTLYALFSYYTGTIENTSHTIYLYSYKTSWTQIGKVSGQTLGSMWLTDKSIAFRGVWWDDNQMAASVHFAKYTYDTGEFVSGTGNWYGKTARTKNTAFVDGRMWQFTENVGAYSDNYGSTVTRFTATTETLSSASTYELLVYGDENYGYYRE